jgi:hypothetical protein
MTNEQIAKVMGLHYFPDCKRYLFHNGDKWCDIDLTSWKFVKLLQWRMVSDGWDVEIRHMTNETQKPFNCVARQEVKMKYAAAATEQEAIVSLFKKVYGGGR